MEPPRTNSTVLSTSPFLTTAESSVPVGARAREGRSATRAERTRVSRSLSRDALSRLDHDLQSLNDTVVRASSGATAALVQQAQDLPDPVRRHRVKPCRVKDQQHGDLMLYEYERPSLRDSEDLDEEDEGEAAVDDDVVLAKPRRRHAAMSASSSPSVPRVAAYAILQATVDAFEATFSQSAAQRLHEDMATTELLYTLCAEPHKRITIERLVLQPRGVSATTRRRDFVVVTCAKRFKLPDGRQGWVQSVQSVDVPIHHLHQSSSERACVRGSVRRSGVVAIESRVHKSTLDVVVTAQLDLRGSASEGANRAVSKRRCVKVLDAVKDALVQHRVETMAFPGTYRFLEIAFEQKSAQCAVCQDKLWRCRVPGWTAARFTCRKCGSSVCGACSHVWTIERTRETTLVGGGRVTTPTRVCNQCFAQPHAGSVDKAALSKTSPSALLRPLQYQQTPQPGSTDRSDRGTSIFAHSQLKPRRASAATTATEAMRPTQLEFHLPSDRSFSLSERSFTLAPPVAYDSHYAPPPAVIPYAIDELAVDDGVDDTTMRSQDLCASMKTIRLDRCVA